MNSIRKSLNILLLLLMVCSSAMSVKAQSVNSLKHGVVESDITVSDDITIERSLYIRRGCTLTLNGNTTINGDVYIWGTLNNNGTLAVSGTINALHYNSSLSAGDYDYGYLNNKGSVSANTLNVTSSYLNKSIPSVTHSWDNGTITKSPTCTEEGIKTYTCYVCDSTRTDNVAALGHSWNAGTVIKNPTCTEKGMRTVKCNVCDAAKTEDIAPIAHDIKGFLVKATTTKDGNIDYICDVCGFFVSSEVVAHPTEVTLSTTSYKYDGKVKKPSVVVKDAEGNVITSANYDVKYASGRKNVGKYKVTVTFKGYYEGSLSATFSIIPKGTSISKVSASSKGFTVKWKKQATQTTGYQIQYCTASNFKGAKTVTVSKNSTLSKKITKLKGKKKYYIRIRTYKTVGKEKVYSAWSGKKSVTTKK